MYIPTHFREEDTTKLHALMRSYAFATLVTVHEGRPFATHLPVVLNPERGAFGTLRGHTARANPQWQDFENGTEALLIFQGPHAYISPAWYETFPAVPTWNYTVVHAYGVPKVVEDAELVEILRDSMAFFDQTERLEALPDDYLSRMMKGIVGFEMEITRLEGKAKMSQNRPQNEQDRVIAALHATGETLDAFTADWMQQSLSSNSES